MTKCMFRATMLATLILIHASAPAQWERVAAIPENTTVSALLVSGDTLYAATDSLVFVSANRSSSWISRTSPAPPPDLISCMLKHDGTLLAGTAQHGVLRTTDEGISWLPFRDGLAGLGSLDISGLQLRGDSLIAGTLGEGVFATTADFSHSWTPIGDSLSAYQGDNVFALLVAGHTALAGAGGNGYIFRYTDGQPWWNPIPINTARLVGQFVYGLASNGTTTVAATNAGIYRTTDEGMSWSKSSFTIPPLTFQMLPHSHGATWYTVISGPMSSWLFASTDDGRSWKSLGEFPQPNVLDAAFIADTLFLGGAGGLWKASLPSFVTAVRGEPAIPLAFRLE